MKQFFNLTLTLLTGVALALPLAAQAQPPKKAAHAAKPAAKPTAKGTTAKKPVRKTKKGVPYKAAKAVEEQTPPQTLSERLSEAELQIAQQVYTGTFPCELGAHVTVTADEQQPGFFTVTSDKLRYYMHPVESRTGAIRMEDNRRGAMWLQLGSKSMLMDQKEGKRVADNCQTAEQKDYAAYLHDHPRHLLDGQQQPEPVPVPTPAPIDAQPPSDAASAPDASGASDTSDTSNQE
jgi:hypothetical protein